MEDGQPERNIRGMLELESTEGTRWRQGKHKRKRWGEAFNAYEAIRKMAAEKSLASRVPVTTKAMAIKLDKTRAENAAAGEKGMGLSTYILKTLGPLGRARS